MADEGSGRPSRRATLTLLVPVSILDLTGRGTFEQATVQCAPQLVCQTQRDHWTYRLRRLALGTLRVPLGGGPGLVLVTWKPEVVSVPEPPHDMGAGGAGRFPGPPGPLPPGSGAG